MLLSAKRFLCLMFCAALLILAGAQANAEAADVTSGDATCQTTVTATDCNGTPVQVTLACSPTDGILAVTEVKPAGTGFYAWVGNKVAVDAVMTFDGGQAAELSLQYSARSEFEATASMRKASVVVRLAPQQGLQRNGRTALQSMIA